MARIEANGLGIEVELRGPEEGEPLLLHMGIGCPLVWWPEPFLDALLDEGFRLILYDHRDTGLSDHLDHLGVPSVTFSLPLALLQLPVSAPYTLDDMARDALGILDALGLDSAHHLGVSMGGMVAQCLALQAPERVRSLSLVMTSPGDRWDSLGSPWAIAYMMGPAPRTVVEAEEALLRASRTIGSPGYPVEEERLRAQARAAWTRGCNPDGYYRHFAAVLAQRDRTERLAELQMPVAILHGAQDPLIPPAAARRMASRMPHAHLGIYEGMGHNLPTALCRDLARVVAETAGGGVPRRAAS